MTKQGLEQSAITLASMTAGAMLSRILVSKLPIKNEKLKKGGLALLGVLGASTLDRNSTGAAIAQDIAIATAVTQTGDLIKSALSEQAGESGILKTALGSPFDDNWNEPFALDSTEFLSSYTPNYDGISEEVEFEEIEEFNS